MSDAVPHIKSVPVDLSGWAEGRAWYPRDGAELEWLLSNLAPQELALIRLPLEVVDFSTRADPGQLVESGYNCTLCHRPVREDQLGAKIYQWCACTLLVSPADHFHLVDSNLWGVWCAAVLVWQSQAR
jgi:hypothetical protein